MKYTRHIRHSYPMLYRESAFGGISITPSAGGSGSAVQSYRADIRSAQCKPATEEPSSPGKGLLGVCAVTRRRFPVGASPTRRFAPAASNRTTHGGDEMSEAFR